MDAAAGLAQLAGERLRVADDRVLRRAVDRETGCWCEARDRRDVDDVAVVGHHGHRGVAAPHHAEHVDLDHAADVGVGELPRVADDEDARVIDPDLDVTALGGRARDRAMTVRISDILVL